MPGRSPYKGCDKPARPPALQVHMSRVRANCIIIARTNGGPAASVKSHLIVYTFL